MTDEQLEHLALSFAGFEIHFTVKEAMNFTTSTYILKDLLDVFSLYGTEEDDMSTESHPVYDLFFNDHPTMYMYVPITYVDRWKTYSQYVIQRNLWGKRKTITIPDLGD